MSVLQTGGKGQAGNAADTKLCVPSLANLNSLGTLPGPVQQEVHDCVCITQSVTRG